ncbi:MAG: hypothetical protein AAGA75_22245 [Cyanobacteria bacterium P01_E01_bin.6]
MSNGVVSEAQGVFVADAKNLVVIETEAAEAVGGWQPETQYDGYTGTGYYRWTANPTITRPGIATLRYNVSLSEAGTYRLSLRGLRNGKAEGRDVESDNENDFWVRINGGSWIKMPFFGPFGEWRWANSLSNNHVLTPAQFDLEAGINTIEISGRSTNAMLDRIHLSKDRVNTQEGKPQSERIDAVAQPPVIANDIDNVIITEANITTEIDLFDVFDDIETQDDDLVYSVTSNSNPGLVSSQINANNGKLILSYTSNVEGNADLTIRATDEDGLSVSTTFNVNVNLPDPPTPPDPTPPDPTPPDPTPPTSPPISPPSPPVTPEPPLPPTSPKPTSIVGTPQNDRLTGTQGDDTIKALGGRDNVLGLSGDDLIFGGRGNEILRGNAGNDKLRGNNGQDRLIGGAGNDELDGGRGRDIYRGGRGEDIFVISTGRRFDVIKDFKEGDLIRLGNNVRPRQLDIFQRGRNTVIARGNDVMAVLQGANSEDVRNALE